MSDNKETKQAPVVEAAAGDPVAWRYMTPTGWHATTNIDRALGAAKYHDMQPLYAAPQPTQAAGEPVAWKSVIAAIAAVDIESSRRGEMFPQTSDEQREDRKACERVREMIRWYATNGGACIEQFKGWPRVAAPQPASKKFPDLTPEPTTAYDYTSSQPASEQQEDSGGRSWPHTRSMLAMGMWGFSTRPDSGKNPDAALRAIDAMTAAGTPLAWLRTAEQQAARGLSDEEIIKIADRVEEQTGAGVTGDEHVIAFARALLAAKGDGHGD